MKKGIKINSELQTLEYVTLGNDFRDIYPIIGEFCTLFECPIIFENRDTVYVDEEGLYQGYTKGFIFEGFEYKKILGNGLILGSNEDGESEDVKYTIEDLQDKIAFFEVLKINK